MSIEVRMGSDGNPICEWGEITYPRPDENGIGPLMLTSVDYFCELMKEPRVWKPGRVDTATQVEERRFIHLTDHDKRYTWELFDAHWWDEQDKPRFYQLAIGRWPD